MLSLFKRWFGRRPGVDVPLSPATPATLSAPASTSEPIGPSSGLEAPEVRDVASVREPVSHYDSGHPSAIGGPGERQLVPPGVWAKPGEPGYETQQAMLAAQAARPLRQGDDPGVPCGPPGGKITREEAYGEEVQRSTAHSGGEVVTPEEVDSLSRHSLYADRKNSLHYEDPAFGLNRDRGLQLAYRHALREISPEDRRKLYEIGGMEAVRNMAYRVARHALGYDNRPWWKKLLSLR